MIDILFGKYKSTFLYSFVAVLAIASFLLNFISLPWLLQGRIVFTETVSIISIAFLLVFSLLAAISITLHFYKSKELKTKDNAGKLGAAGAFLGFFTSACSVCYPLILTAIGIPTALAILPFGGLEIQALSLLLLLVSIFIVRRSIKKGNVCK